MPVLSQRKTARADLMAIVEYIADDNPDAAMLLPYPSCVCCMRLNSGRSTRET
ncbi:MAG: hypothetical protein FWH34_00705 [Desulfovibrionaceae bacterium]|nr:hypothetical protein [Desulfovibrionaceae bacterium]